MSLVPQVAATESSPLPSGLMDELALWFKGRPLWLQDAARRLLEGGEIQQQDLDELLVLCKMEAGVPVDASTRLTAKPPRDGAFTSAESRFSLRLESISQVQGINALAPRNPLQFGAAQLTIVYGSNGSGKSGYMRLLKHACGARAPGALLPNVFSSTPPAQSCKFAYTKDGVVTECEWTPVDGVHSDLRAVSIYDTECAYVHVTDENQLSFEPGILGVIRRLVEISDGLARQLDSEISTNISHLPKLPPTHLTTETGEWYATITESTTDEEIGRRCSWTKEDEEQLKHMNQRRSETNPGDAAAALRKKLAYLQAFARRLEVLTKQISDERFASLLVLRADAAAKRRAAEIDAATVFENAPLDGVGTESWKLLWQQARVFSETEAYTAYEFPHVADEALCVLCQQPLSADAATRLATFEAFVKGGLEREAQDAEARVSAYLATLEELPAAEEVEEQLDLSGVEDAAIRQAVAVRCDKLRQRRESFLIATEVSQLSAALPDTVDQEFAPLITKYDEQAKQYEVDAASGKKEELEKTVAELTTREWIAAQKQAIVTEVLRRRLNVLLQSARRLVNTQALSTKTSTLAETLVTAAFKERFAKELKSLGGSRIKVSIDKTRAVKGQAWHKVQLVGSTQSGDAGRILSEGEFRVVSIAAFLADVEGHGANTPVLFDDPVTSLDQDFEEATCQRLVSLSRLRQVIIFTHRLSLLSMLEGAAKASKVDCHVLSLQHEPWGAGEPTDPPHSISKPKKALNALHGQRVPQARKVLDGQGSIAYRDVAKGICSDIRILVERIVELDLLAGVIERFRRPVQTMGKLENLAKITPVDCAYIDEMMTKYSRYEHSQPGEAPVALPDPDEFDTDLTKLKAWLEEFTARPIPPV